MGLDQYLYKETYVKRWNHMNEDELFTVNVSKGGNAFEYINPEKVAYIREEVAYWRKSNQIHNWFVENIQNGIDDCGTYDVSHEQLGELVSLCEQVLENRDKAQELLPAQGGFFFGSTEYDEYYFQDLEYTVETLKPLVEEAEKARQERHWMDFTYRSSW
jgi:hypothetical protein